MTDHHNVSEPWVPDLVPCERRVDLGTYLLGGLGEDESRALRAHIDTCITCSTELRSLRPVTDLVGSVQLADLQFGERHDPQPDPDLSTRIITRALAELTAAHLTAAHLTTRLDVAGPTTGGDGLPTVVDLRTPGARRSAPRRRWLPAAAAIALFAAGAGSVLGAQRLTADSQTQEAQGERVRFASVSLSNFATPSTAETAPKAWAWVGQTNAGTYATLYTRNLEPDETYRWWFERQDGTRVGLGSFRYPAGSGDWLVCPGSTAEPRSSLVAIGATDSSGHEVLRTQLAPEGLTRS